MTKNNAFTLENLDGLLQQKLDWLWEHKIALGLVTYGAAKAVYFFYNKPAYIATRQQLTEDNTDTIFIELAKEQVEPFTASISAQNIPTLRAFLDENSNFREALQLIYAPQYQEALQDYQELFAAGYAAVMPKDQPFSIEAATLDLVKATELLTSIDFELSYTPIKAAIMTVLGAIGLMRSESDWIQSSKDCFPGE